MRRRNLLPLALAAMAIPLAGCGSARDSARPASRPSTAAPPSTAATSAAAPATGAVISSTLDGKRVLPQRLRWRASLPAANISQVAFVIDGSERWVEHEPPYYYDGDDAGAKLLPPVLGNDTSARVMQVSHTCMNVCKGSSVTLPPGQRRVDGFPRFGTHLHHPPPAVPAAPAIEIGGAVAAVVSVPVDKLASLPRRELTADFHCVAGWTATDLRWEGVALRTLFRTTIEPMITPGATITHLEFRGLDGYRSILSIEDALGDDVLIADRLGGRPLTRDHGAPVRLVSPQQYGFMSTKHVCRIALHSESPNLFRKTPLIDAHPRARVWEEERHRYLPAKPLRPVYRMLIPPLRFLSARGSRDG